MADNQEIHEFIDSFFFYIYSILSIKNFKQL